MAMYGYVNSYMAMYGYVFYVWQCTVMYSYMYF